MDQNKIKVIKIGRDALYELIYETFVEHQEEWLGVDSMEVSNHFVMDWERGEFLFCAAASEDEKGEPLPLPPEVNLPTLIQRISDTTQSVFQEDRYREYTKQELMDLSKWEVPVMLERIAEKYVGHIETFAPAAQTDDFFALPDALRRILSQSDGVMETMRHPVTGETERVGWIVYPLSEMVRWTGFYPRFSET